jgi:hypothetical protein
MGTREVELGSMSGDDESRTIRVVVSLFFGALVIWLLSLVIADALR